VYQAPGLGPLGFRYLKDPQYYKQIVEIVWGRAVGPVVCVLAALGFLIPSRNRYGWFAHVYLAGAVSSLFLTPGLHLANDYYQAFFAPPAALLAGRFLGLFFRRRVLAAVAVAAVVAGAATSVQIAGQYYARERISIFDCGKWIRENTRPTDRVLVGYKDPTVLYYADRIGWICRDQADGEPMGFNRELIDRTRALGATLLAIPLAKNLDNYKGNRAYSTEMRSYLYDTYYCERNAGYAVFFLDKPADLDLPGDGYVDLGAQPAYKYLRGDWGPMYKSPPHGSFVHQGPEQASIVFNAPAGLRRVVLKVSAEKAGRQMRINVDEKLTGETTLGNAWQIQELPIDFDPPTREKARHTLRFRVTNQDGQSNVLLFWTLQAELQP
jgi:hypothetical protein